MKKKVLLIAGIVLAVAVLAVLIIFLSETSGIENTVEYDMTGPWKIWCYVGEAKENEYFVFNEDTVDYYLDDVETPKATYSYTQKGLTLNVDTFDDIAINAISENVAVLKQKSTEKEWRIMRVAGIGAAAQSDRSAELIIGDWKLTYHGDQQIADEKMTFTEAELIDYRDGELFGSFPYYWTEDGKIRVDTMDKTITVFPLNDDLIILADQDMTLWELVRN